jgi:hypothetical protein
MPSSVMTGRGTKYVTSAKPDADRCRIVSFPRAFATEAGGLSPLANVDVDIEIDVADASLHRAVGSALVPETITRANISDIGKFQTPPLRQSAAAFSGELPRQHDFFATSVRADDMRTQFASTAAIAADHLLFAEDGVAEEGVGLAGHWG